MRPGLINGLLLAAALALAVVVVVQVPGWFRDPAPLAGLGRGAASGADGPGGKARVGGARGITVSGKRNPFASSQPDKAGNKAREQARDKPQTLDPAKLKFEVLGVVVGQARTYAIAASRAAGKGEPFRVEVGSRLDGFQVDRITSDSLWLIGDDGQRYQYELGQGE